MHVAIVDYQIIKLIKEVTFSNPISIDLYLFIYFLNVKASYFNVCLMLNCKENLLNMYYLHGKWRNYITAMCQEKIMIFPKF